MSLGVCFKNYTSSEMARLLDTSVKIRAIFTVRFERRKADERANQYKNWNIQNSVTESSEYFCQMSQEIDTVSKLMHFFCC